MALDKLGLGDVTQVAASSTSSVYTVASSKTAFIRSIIIHNLDNSATTNVKVHVVPNSGGSAGTAAAANRILNITLEATDTYFAEFAFPITLSDNNDTIQVQNANTSNALNVLILGDTEG